MLQFHEETAVPKRDNASAHAPLALLCVADWDRVRESGTEKRPGLSSFGLQPHEVARYFASLIGRNNVYLDAASFGMHSPIAAIMLPACRTDR